MPNAWRRSTVMRNKSNVATLSLHGHQVYPLWRNWNCVALFEVGDGGVEGRGADRMRAALFRPVFPDPPSHREGRHRARTRHVHVVARREIVRTHYSLVLCGRKKKEENKRFDSPQILLQSTALPESQTKIACNASERRRDERTSVRRKTRPRPAQRQRRCHCIQ